MAVHMVDRVKEMVAEALDARPNTEDIGWDVAMQGTEQGPVVVVLMMRPGAVLGTMVSAVGAVKDPIKVDSDGVTAAVHDMMRTMDEERSRQLSGDERSDDEEGLGPLPASARTRLTDPTG